MQQINGTIKELSIPISKKGEKQGYFVLESEQFTYWYRFQGDLQDEKEKITLIPLETAVLEWLPASDIYGLSIGADSYLIPSMITSSDVLSKTDQESGRLSFYLKPLASGTLLNATFKGIDNSDVLKLT
jgi:hypothetical protein